MAAVFSGNGLGLFDSSWSRWGIAAGGSASLGQGQDGQYVNVATGGLLLQAQDEQLVFRGLSIAQLRTYNSQGTVAQAGADGWVTGFERRVSLLSGTFDTAGSVMRVDTGDGGTQDFTWAGPGRYVSSQGAGADDSLTWSGASSTWTLVEGSTQRAWVFANHADPVQQGRLVQVRDLRSDGTTPAAWDVLYDGNNRVWQVRAADGTGGGDELVFGYDATGRLTLLSTRENGITTGQVRYGYDTCGRLSEVLVDLTPDTSNWGNPDDTWNTSSAAANDTHLFRTVYAYEGTSLRISSVTQSDGTLVSYTYDASGRVRTVTRGDLNTNDTDGAGQTITYAYDDASGTTDVIDASGRTWSYVHDAQGRLTQVLAPAIAGLRDVTAYVYDAANRLVQVKSTRGSQVLAQSDYAYDASGNRTWEWILVDPAQGASAIQRTYDAANQLLSETHYTGLDADGAGSAQVPTGGQTTHFVYDAQSRLRFVIDAAGAVTEYQYATSGNAIGQQTSARRYLGAAYAGTSYALVDLNGWATSTQKQTSALTETTYDAGGRIAQVTRYAAVAADGSGVLDDSAEIVQYTYDPHGLLHSTYTLRSSTTTANDGRDIGDTTTYAYDGMGRLLSEVHSATQRDVAGNLVIAQQRTTTWTYLDSAATLRTTFEGGVANDGTDNDLVRTQVRDAVGQLVSVTESAVSNATTTRTTHNYYDASGQLRASEDASGARTYYFYDAKGALVGKVDETGALIESVRDGAGRVTATKAYSVRLDTSGWLVNGAVAPTTYTAPSDPAVRVTTFAYDDAGKLLTQTDPAGTITAYAYDADGRLLQTTVTDPADPTHPRVARQLYDGIGRLVGTLDAAGYLTEFQYDVAGRLVKTLRYATATPTASRASGTLAQLRPVSDVLNDQVARRFYDGRDQLVGELDAEGYLTEYVYDESRHQRAERRYAKQLTGLSGSETFAGLRTTAQTGAVHETRRSYDALGQLVTEVNFEGTVTRYTYDAAGNLTGTIVAENTSDLREGHRRYDVFGNLIGELGGEGSTHLVANMTEPQLDALYAQYGTRHSYDALGHRIESIDAQGNKTWYFYDAAGRQTFLVRGVAENNAGQTGALNSYAEVTETRYDAFGEVTDSIAYTGRIALGTPGDRASVGSALTTLAYVSAVDSKRSQTWTTRGLLASMTDAAGTLTRYTYDGYGQLKQLDRAVGTTAATSTQYGYDSRGLQTSRTEALGATEQRTTSQTYDAFGRVATATDGNDNTITFGYDRLGRQVTRKQTVGTRLEAWTTTYDAFARVLTQVDALQKTTSYFYDDVARSMTMTTPEGVVVKTVHKPTGETWTIADAAGHTTEYHYDRDGHLTSTSAPDGGTEVRTYDTRGLLVRITDATNRAIQIDYDAVGRVLRRTVDPADPANPNDPSKLKLTTSYTYDGQGRQVKVTDPLQVQTTHQYDAEGRLLQTVVDATGLQLTTTYTLDALGRQLTVTEGTGASAHTVAYQYDDLGRRILETVDPGAGKLNLVTAYTYDDNGNVASRTDAEGRITRYTYDAANRQIYAIDGAGGVRQTWYDADGRVVATRDYAKALDVASLPAVVTTADVAPGVTALRDNAHDVQAYFVYDDDGRQVFAIHGAGTSDGAGAVTKTLYDTLGRETGTVRYATAVALTSLYSKLENGQATPDDIVVASNAAVDQTTYRVYDAAGRVRYAIGADGAVTEQVYDLAGRVTQAWSYATPLALTTSDRDALAKGTFTEGTLASRVSAQAATARAQYTVFDAAGRVLYVATRLSATTAAVTGRTYDAVGRTLSSTVYGITVPFSPTQTAQALGSALDAALSTDPTVRATQMRTTRYVYDAAGRQRFVVDAAGALSETGYDATGQRIASIQYEAVPTGALTLAGLQTWAAGQPSSAYRKTTFTYDMAGRLQSQTRGADTAAASTQSWTYDGTGLVKTFTDGNNNLWTYAYDNAGRRTKEISPQVEVATVATDGTVSLPVPKRSIETRIAYDALGNVVSRSEDAGTDANGNNVGIPRTTTYQYDNCGHQVRTIFPDAYALNASGVLVATGVQPDIQVTYDTFGRAVVQKDVLGNYSYKVYDQAGRLAYDVDQEHNVTRYAYNGFGEQTTLTRYANELVTTSIANWSEGKALSLAQIQAAGVVPPDAANDRTLTTTYDQRGNKLSIQQSQITYYNAAGMPQQGTPTRQFAYDAYGDLTKESVLLEGTAGQSGAVWADTWHWYDALGRNTVMVDAEGYVTCTEYNATGEATSVTEFARAIATTALQATTPPALPESGDTVIGYDRITRWDYDALGRKVAETSVRHYQRADGSGAQRDVVTAYGYDKESHVTAVTSDAGTDAATTVTTAYDALGRATSVREPSRSVLASTYDTSLKTSTANSLATGALYVQASPYTTMAYDAFGNTVQVRRYANGWVDGASSAVASTTLDQIQTTRYDRQGRAVWEKDAEGGVVTRAFDAADHVTLVQYRLNGNAGRWSTVSTTIGYDKVGRQASTKTSRDNYQDASGTSTLVSHSDDASEWVSYNAFGEIAAKARTAAEVENVGARKVMQYNAAGFMEASNADAGVLRRYRYNLAGVLVREERDWTDLAGAKQTAVFAYAVDRLGRATVATLPSYVANASATTTVRKTFDRWGNTLQLIDARGFQTNYQYNQSNQVVHEQRPLVEVVDEHGVSSWLRPTNDWFYDAFGRLIGTRDANGNVRRNLLDAVGQLVQAKDALGNATLYAYDALGNERTQQDAMGHVTFKAYDRLNRVTSLGDYLPSPDGTTRLKYTLQSFVLNQNGDRIAVTDALGYVSYYDFDSRNLLLRSQSAENVVNGYLYDADGHKAEESNAFTATSTVKDRDGNDVRLDEQTWVYDVFGRLIDHNNFGRRDYNYTYDPNSGALTSESQSGGPILVADGTTDTDYYANGLVRQVTNNLGDVYKYEYDANGNRTLEDSTTHDGNGQLVHIVTHTYYDSNNRIQRVVQDDLSSGTSKRVFDVTYEYDAVGNRRHVKALSGYGPTVDGITVTDTAPEKTGSVSDRTARTGIVSTFRVRKSDLFQDAEQDTLTINAALSSGAALPPWLTMTTDAVTGELVFTATNPSTTGTWTIQLTAVETKDASKTATSTFKLSVVSNTAPTALGGTLPLRAKTGEDWGVELGAGDIFQDPDIGDAMTLSLVTTSLPAWLQVDLSNPSVLRFSGVPTESVATNYNITVKATDQRGGTGTRVIQIQTGPNRAPVKASTLAAATATTNRDFSWIKNLSQVFTDPDGDPLEVTASLATGAALPDWMDFQFLTDQATPQLALSGQVPASELGKVYTVRFTAVDEDGLSVTSTLTVNVLADRAPTVVPSGTWVAPAGRVNYDYNHMFAISSLFTDPEGDPVSISEIWPTGSHLPEWLSVTVDQDAGTVSFHGKPTSNLQAGTLSFQLVGKDTDGLTTALNASIFINTDSPPTRTSASVVDRTLSIGRSFSFTLPSNTFVDADGDPVTITAGLARKERDDTGTTVYVDPLPSWMHFDGQTFYGTVPAGTAEDTFQIRLTATDGKFNNPISLTEYQTYGVAGNNSDSDIWITLAPWTNQPPTYQGGLPNRTLKDSVAVDFIMPATAFSEPDGDALTYSAQVLVGSTWVSISQLGLSINPSTGEITGTARNLTQTSFSARIIASDPQGLQAIGSFTFSVTNTPPVVSATIPTQNWGRNVACTFDANVYFNDVNNDTLTFTGSGLPAGLTLNSNGLITGSAATLGGPYTVTLTANDGRGGTATTSFTLNIVNSAPVAPTIPAQTTPVGTAWSYIVPSFTDANGDTLTYTASGLPSWMSFNASTHTLSGTSSASGSWTITVTASDGTVATSKSFVVTTPNVAPVVAHPIVDFSKPRNAAFTYVVPAGTFSDANGDALTLTASGMPSGVTFDGSKFTGTATLSGSFTIVLTANDGYGHTVSDSFVLTITDNPPQYNGGLVARTANLGTAISWPLPAGTFTDPNGDAITYTLLVERPAYTTTMSGGEGELTHPAAWMDGSNVGLSINANTGQITGTASLWTMPAGAYDCDPSNYSIKIIASDATGSAEATFGLNVNRVPTAPTIPNQAIKSAVAWSYTVPLFADADGDTLTYSISALPAGLSWNASTRVISGTPTTAGTTTVTVTANDGHGGVTSKSFTITVQADTAPTAPTIANQTATNGAAWTFTVPAFTDADGDALTYTATGMPPGLSFNATTRVISGTPTTNGTYTVTVTANDGRGGVTPKSFTITVITQANRAPVLVSLIPDVSTMTGDVFSYNITSHFSDPDGNPLTYTAVRTDGQAFPSWLTFSSSGVFSGTVTGVVTADYSIQVTARDPSGLTVSDTFVIHKQGDSGSTALMSTSTSAGSGGSGTKSTGNGSDNGASTRFGAGNEQATQHAASNSNVAASGGSTSGGIQMLTATTTSTTETIAPQLAESWFTYDANNRQKIYGGVLSGGNIVLGDDQNTSYELLYDAVGNTVGRHVRVMDANTRIYSDVVYRSAFDLRGLRTMNYSGQALGSTATSSVNGGIKYDALGRVVELRQYYGAGATAKGKNTGEGYYDTYSIAGWLFSAETHQYDKDGHEIKVVSLGRGPSTLWGQLEDADSAEITRQKTDLSVLDGKSIVDYTGGYDTVGRLLTYSYTAEEISWAKQTFTNTYEGWDSYQEKTVNGSSSDTNYKATTNSLTYDALGRLVKQDEHTPLPNDWGTLEDRTKFYSYEGDGKVLTRREGTTDANGVFTQPDTYTGSGVKPNYEFVYAAGQEIAELAERGQTTLANGYILSSGGMSDVAGLNAYAEGGEKVAVLAGDTLSSVAERVYGNANLWYVLADANGLSGADAKLVAGTQLEAPKINVSSNDASTFKPYDPGEAIGPTTPGLPYITPPPKHHCGYIGIVIRLVAIVVAAVMTAYGFGFAARFVVAAAFEATAQKAEMEHGYRQSWDWGAVAAAGASAAAGGAGGAATSTGQAIAIAAASAAANYVTAYAVNRALGQDVHFSLRQMFGQVASAAVTTALFSSTGSGKSSDTGRSAGGLVSNAVGETRINWSQVAAAAVKDTAINAAKNVVGSWVYSTVAGEPYHFDARAVLVDAFGNAVANETSTIIRGGFRTPVEREIQESPSTEVVNPSEGQPDPTSVPSTGGVGNQPSLAATPEQTKSQAITKTYGAAGPVPDDLGFYNTPTPKPTAPPEPGFVWAWQNVTGEWRQVDPNAPIRSLERVEVTAPENSEVAALVEQNLRSGIGWGIFSASAIGRAQHPAIRPQSVWRLESPSDRRGAELIAIGATADLLQKHLGPVAVGVRFADQNGGLWADLVRNSGGRPWSFGPGSMEFYGRFGSPAAWELGGNVFEAIGKTTNILGPIVEGGPLLYAAYNGEEVPARDWGHLAGTSTMAAATAWVPETGGFSLLYGVADIAAQGYHYTPEYGGTTIWGLQPGEQINGWSAIYSSFYLDPRLDLDETLIQDRMTANPSMSRQQSENVQHQVTESQNSLLLQAIYTPYGGP
jgi:YD repeat-containing protein